MKKTTLRQAAMKLAIVAIALFAPLGLRAQETVTVHDGTTTNSVIPAYIMYFDDYTRSQYVIPATELEDMSGGTINAIKFYTTNQNVPYTTVSTVDVYLMEVGYTTMTALEPKANGTIVYQGYLNVVSEGTGGSLTITFSTPYTYGGGNLLVGIENTTDVNYKSIYFYGESVNGASWGGYNSSSLTNVTGSQRNFIPKTTFTYEPAQQGGDVCDKPSTCEISDVTATSATLTWSGGSGTYNVEVKGGEWTDWTAILTNTALTTTTLTLQPTTSYQARVQSVCDGSTPTSGWKTSASFSTPCGETTLPYFYGFEDASPLACWTMTDCVSSTGRYQGTANTDSYCFRFYYGYNDQFLISPELSGTGNGVYFSFYYRQYSNGTETFHVGYSTTTNSTDAFTWGDEMTATTSYQLYENVFPAGTKYVAIKLTSYDQYYLYIDDVNLTLPPTCYMPTAAQVDEYDQTTATISWVRDTRNADGETYSILMVREGDDDLLLTTSTTPAVSISGSTASLTGLTQSTPYSFKVVTNCANTEENVDFVPLSFTTLANCPAPTATLTDNSVTAHGATIQWNDLGSTGYNVRYQVSNSITVDFESGSLPDGWTANTTSSSSGVQSNQGRNNSYGFRFHYTESGATLVSPVLSGTENGVNFSFYYRRNSDSYTEGFKVGYNTDGSDEFTYGDEISVTNTSSWLQYENAFPAGTKRIAIQYVYHDAMYLHIDDIEIVIPNDNWTTDNTANTNYTITGLTAETRYLAQVQSVCGEDVSSWSEGVSFTTEVACPSPTALTNGTPSPSQVELTWVKNGEETEWQICINNIEENPVDVAEADVNVNSETSVVTYTLTNLTPSTSYETKVRANCGDVDGHSAWTSPVSFTTQAACPTPVLNAITEFTAHTADVEWSNFTENTNYEVSYRTAAYFDGVTEEFGTTPTGWAQYTGLLNNGGTATLNSTSSGWIFDNNNGVFDNHARVNIYSTCNRWLVTPALTVPENGALTFDMALTAFSGNLVAPGTSGTDDKFVVLITTDEMATWTVLREWNNSGSEYVYNNIPCSATGENVMIDLGEYVDQTVRIAFYGESTVSNADNNLHIDNVGIGVAVEAGEWETEELTENSIELTGLVAETTYEVKVKGLCSGDQENESEVQTFTTLKACPSPTALTAGAATTNSVPLSWTAGAANQDNWQICLNGDETNLLDVTDATVTGTTVTYTLTGLTSGADYSVKVRANCGDEDGVSQQWTDTVNFTTDASCTEPSTLAVVENSVQAHQVQLSWTAGGEEESWDIYYSNTNSAPVNGVTEPTIEGVTENNPYTLIGLTDARTYYVWVRAHCGDAAGQQSPWVGPVSFSTPQEAVTAPYADDFENGNNWLLVNGNLNNAWAYGEAVYNGGTHALYISNDGGATNAYNNGSAAMVYATKLITFEEGTYKFSYDWKANGESTYDYLRVALGPATTTLTAGTSVPTGFSTTTLPTGWTALDGGSKLNLKTDWQSYGSAEMPIAAGTYMMVFAWKNDGIGGSNPPAAIDNVSIEKITCIAPTALAASNVTAHAATLGWTAGADEEAWQIAYGTTADFDQDDVTPIDDVTENPYLFGNLTQSTHYYVYVRAKCGEDDYSNWSNMTDFNTISGKQMPTGLTVTDIASATATATWTGVTTNVLHESYDLYYSKLSSMPETLNEDSLFTGVTTTTHVFANLESEVTYYVWVRDICGTDGESDWTSTSFTTLPSCPTPTDLTATNITNNAATIRWTGSSDVDNYTVQYREAEGINTNGGLNENFNSLTTANSIPEGWSNDEGSTSTASHKWCYNTSTSGNGATNGTSHDGSKCVRFNSYTNSSNNTNFLQTPSMDFPAGETMMLSFWWKNPTAGDFSVYISTDGGTTKTPIAEGLTGQSTWTQATYELTDYVGASNVTIHFKGTSNYGNGDAYIYLDDIMVGYTVPAGEWNDATEDVAEQSYTITGLDAETKYDVQVKSNCTNGEYSAPYTFTTASVFTKSIQANKWYAIATPAHDCVKPNDAVALTNVLNLTTADHDLYSYDEANGSWMAASDSLMTGTGYIYRSAADAELGFVGYANTGSVSVSITSSTTTDPDLKGFNLIGNPYPHTVAVRRAFYTLEPEGTWMAKTSGNTITAAEACLVQTSYSTTYTFNDETPTPTPSKSSSDHAALAFTVSNEEYSDVAYAMLENGDGLPKIGHLAANAPMLSIPVEGRRYAIANLGSDCESFDMVFRGVSGTYTLSFSGNSSYCHLVDRVAGKEIDMLRQNYTFSSNGFDADRFTVKLSPDAQENAGSNFAYWNGNVWMVEGNGTLQVFDALGRQLFSQEISNSNFEIQNSLFPAAGVYVLRMGEKTQKIVVR